MEEEFKLDPKRVAKARILTDTIILVVVGCGLLAVTAWFTSRPLLFYITAGLSTVVSIVYVMVMIITGFSKQGSGFIPVCILLLIIGILVTHKFLPGILLGGSFFGLYAMGPLAYHQIRMKRELRDKEIEDAVLEKEKERKLDTKAFPEDLIERVNLMEDAYDDVRGMVSSLNSSIDKYLELQARIDLLDQYQESKQWIQDYEADEAGMIPSHVKRGVLSEDGLDNLLRDVEDVEDRMTSIVADLIDPDFPEDLSEE